MKHRRRTELPVGGGPAGQDGSRAAVLVVLAAALGLMTACIPDEVTLRESGAGDVHVREGRLGTAHPIVASAGAVQVLDVALDLGAQACSEGAGGSRICVHGGITAGGRSAR